MSFNDPDNPKVEAFLPYDTRNDCIAKLAKAGVRPYTVDAFKKAGDVKKERHSARADSGRFRPVRPDEKLGFASAWRHGGAVHPALLPKS